jgi:N-acetylmuramoyl-L-alanine amidase
VVEARRADSGTVPSRYDVWGEAMALRFACVLFLGIISGAATAVAGDAPSLDNDIDCLALAVYWEARSESDVGQRAIAHVTLNRVESEEFPDTVCGVVKQGVKYGKFRCQYSWVCDGKADIPTEHDAWLEAVQVATKALQGRSRDPTSGSLHFHLTRVKPAWTKKMIYVRQIDDHVFYK